MQNFFEEVIARLTQAEVEFVIVGGVSAVLQGAPIVTKDLDLCYRRTPANIARLATALAPLQPRLRGFPPDLPFTFDERALKLGTNFTLKIGDEDLDLLGEMSALGGYEQIVGRGIPRQGASPRSTDCYQTSCWPSERPRCATGTQRHTGTPTATGQGLIWR